MTDTSTYTGSHKERFDESGKGKGLEGRKDYDANASEGYVGGYKGKDTYDKTHQFWLCQKYTSNLNVWYDFFYNFYLAFNFHQTITTKGLNFGMYRLATYTIKVQFVYFLIKEK